MEIGSEFSSIEYSQGEGIYLPDNVLDECLTFSGRTAIETVIMNEKKIKRIIVPSYCCEAMLVPFIKEHIELVFFNVFFDSGLKIELNITDDIDAILWCNYFGFECDMPDLSEFVQRGGIIIEDITHSLYSSKQYNKQSHYLIASIRKWGPLLSGGYCASRKNKLFYKPNNKPSSDYLFMKDKAMKLKSEFLKGYKVNKSDFLELFANCNKWLVENYSSLTIDDYSKNILTSIDAKKEYTIRKTNAKFLYTRLIEIDDIQFMFPEKNMDCPLFVPIVIKNGKRDLIRKKLLDNRIYCPIHWPKPNVNCESNIYDLELSLVCDQRYNDTDMSRMISVINKAVRKDY